MDAIPDDVANRGQTDPKQRQRRKPQPKPITVFISHSKLDREFAGMLDASLCARGILTFFDERDILIGHSIPKRMYEGLKAATHLAYVISKHSIRSKWVQEELEIAKVREKRSRGPTILPLLIEDLEVPPAVLNVRYADFRQWHNPELYKRALDSVLEAVGVHDQGPAPGEYAWYITHLNTIQSFNRTLNRVCGRLEGALDSTSELREAHYMTAKYLIEDEDLLGAIESFTSKCLLYTATSSANRLPFLKNVLIESTEFANTALVSRSGRRDRDLVERYWRLLSRANNMMDEIRQEVERYMFRGSTSQIN